MLNKIMELRLNLKRKWFEMTDTNGKTEDYRSITPYWIKRLVELDNSDEVDLHDFITSLSNINTSNYKKELNYWRPRFKSFTQNVMTLGYPSNDQTERFKRYRHKGEWWSYGSVNFTTAKVIGSAFLGSWLSRHYKN